MKKSYILEINNLSKSFGDNHVLHNVSLKIKPGSILGLMGENGAGKSTLMKCLFGVYSKDEGTIVFQGKKTNFLNPKNALEHGVAMVHQELNQCLERTVLDNLFLGRYIVNRFGIIDEAKMKEKAMRLFSSLSLSIDPMVLAKKLSVSERQMVEIAKAVSYDAKVIILDEPTSSLSDREISRLFEIITSLKKKGVSFIYISHKIDEIFKICDEVTVLRDGELIMSKSTKSTNMNDLIAAMVGRPLTNRFPTLRNKPEEVILEVKNLSTAYPPFLKDINFSVKKGEIFGIYGLVGAGRSELLEALFGLRKLATGYLKYHEKRLRFNGAKEAMSYNFALVTEERKINGIFSKADLVFNTTITNLERYLKYHILQVRKMELATKKEMELMKTKANSIHDPITSLSGGNQQKIILGKWMDRNPDIFLMDEPTRGIDVGAKYEIYELMVNMAKAGKTIIVVTSEMPEILGITNRIAVMSNHRLSGIVNTKSATQEELLRLSAKYL